MSYTDYCFTLKQSEEADLVRLAPLTNYIVVGSETGEDGYEHFQGFLQLKKRMPLRSLKYFSATAHFEQRRGTVEEAMQYCMKDGDFYQQGQVQDHPGQGARTDLEAFYDDAKEGTDPVTMYRNHTSNMIRYRRAYDDIRSTHASPDREPAQVHWLFGDSGTGKGSFVRSFAARHRQLKYDKVPTDSWWCGYTDQKIIQIDEITAAIPYNSLLRFGDRTLLRLPIKGGHATSCADTVFITSNLPPEQVYPREFALLPEPALLRRAAFYRVRRVAVGRSSLERMRFTSTGWESAGEPVREFDVEPTENPSVAHSLCMQE